MRGAFAILFALVALWSCSSESESRESPNAGGFDSGALGGAAGADSGAGGTAGGGPSDSGSGGNVSTDSGTGPQFALTTGVAGRNLPYFGSVSLGVGSTTATRAIIVVHGTNRNAKDYYDRVQKAAALSGASAETAVFAPHFLIADDQPSSSELFWDDNSDWKRGDPSTATLSPRISSFAVVDAMVELVADTTRFPKLSQLVLVGHSAGGQFVQRFAMGAAPVPSHLSARYVPANPSSYAYLDDKRVVGTTFVVPTTSCSWYNDWKYGLEDLNPFMQGVGVAVARNRYGSRDVRYLLGADDKDPASADLDATCAATLQGAHRLERGQTYFAHVADHYQTQPHALVVVPGVGHSSTKMFQSEAGRSVIFGP